MVAVELQVWTSGPLPEKRWTKDGEAGPSPGEAEPGPGEAGPGPGKAGPSPGEDEPSPGEAGPSPGEAGPGPGEVEPGDHTLGNARKRAAETVPGLEVEPPELGKEIPAVAGTSMVPVCFIPEEGETGTVPGEMEDQRKTHLSHQSETDP
ncbi:basic proline-rich protein-like [Macrobrachium nipponense]|uniref:basic proline-rich protein-like n=1 Tax=Macrobrachium nipponense TaxID=159736 RepID=UPI0030C7C983